MTNPPDMAHNPRLVDLFCGAGGAAMGYHQAGFEVVGVDIRPQKNYPFEFILYDACTFPLDGFDAIHASPPCQKFSITRHIKGRDHPDLLTPIRERLKKTDIPWIIENVPGAPLEVDLVLCGTQFGLKANDKQIRRHRWFEFGNWSFFNLLPPCNHFGKAMQIFGHGGKLYPGADDWREAMEIDWTTRDEISQAIPPAFTEYIGRQLMKYLNGKNIT